MPSEEEIRRYQEEHPVSPALQELFRRQISVLTEIHDKLDRHILMERARKCHDAQSPITNEQLPHGQTSRRNVGDRAGHGL